MKLLTKVLFAVALCAVARPALAGDISWRNTGVAVSDDGNGTKTYVSSSLFTDPRGVAKAMGSANSASLFQMTTTVAAGTTLSVSTNVLSLELTIASTEPTKTSTVFTAALPGGAASSTVVLATGTTSYRMKALPGLTNSITGGPITQNAFVASITSAAVAASLTGDYGMSVNDGVEEKDLDVGATGSTRWVCSLGTATCPVSLIQWSSPRVCVSRISMAAAAAGNGYILRVGQKLNLPDLGGSVAQTFYMVVYRGTSSVVTQAVEQLKEN